MGLEDRHWYKEDFDRRMGKGTKKEPEKYEQPTEKEKSHKPEESKTGSTRWKNNHKPKAERVGKRKPEEREYEKSWQVPPADAVLAAKYALAMKARTKKTFWGGFAFGVLAASCAMVAVMRLI
ncbi:MAG: hypothetical protein K2Y24_01680 [Pseudomonadaceae bacterium]|nr:hypothetical protein [Pseudomonadaceae bacterium]